MLPCKACKSNSQINSVWNGSCNGGIAAAGGMNTVVVAAIVHIAFALTLPQLPLLSDQAEESSQDEEAGKV
jgi:hypothetical protein